MGGERHKKWVALQQHERMFRRNMSKETKQKVLSEKQIKFIYEYLSDGKKNATAAAKRAGYSEKTAKQKASSLLKDKTLLACLHAHEQLKALEKKVNLIDENFVLNKRLDILETSTRKIPVNVWNYSTHKNERVGERCVDGRTATMILRDIADSISTKTGSVDEKTFERLISVLQDIQI